MGGDLVAGRERRTLRQVPCHWRSNNPHVFVDPQRWLVTKLRKR